MVSVIIPVYQVSDYVERCILSVMAQTFTDIECIIVDDATEDDSIEKCEKIIAEANPNLLETAVAEQATIGRANANDNHNIRFKILHHEVNRGLSAARNTGTKAATGEYLYYLDSDDYISPDCIETLMAPFNEDDALEMVQGNCLKICDGVEGIVYKGKSLFIKNNNDVRTHYLSYHHIYISVWNKLLKKSFVDENRLYCKEGIIYEDHLWMFYLMKCLQNAYLSDAVTYYYSIRQGSIVTSTDKKTEGNSFRVIFDDVLNHLTPDNELFELKNYLYMFCKRYLTFVGDVPAFYNTLKLYKKRSKQYGCWYIYMVLVTIGVIGHFGNPSKILGWLNDLRWKVKRKKR